MQSKRRNRWFRLAALFTGAVIALLAVSPAFAHETGGAAPLPTSLPPAPAPLQTTTLPSAQLSPDGRTAIAPVSAPDEVKSAIYAANQITRKPYRYGGGHRRNFQDNAYDCSGSVSYALHGGGFLKRPFDSSSLMGWGDSGPGQWITVYTNRGHAYVVLAALRLDTSGSPSGPRWRRGARASTGFTARHPAGF